MQTAAKIEICIWKIAGIFIKAYYPLPAISWSIVHSKSQFINGYILELPFHDSIQQRWLKSTTYWINGMSIVHFPPNEIFLRL